MKKIGNTGKSPKALFITLAYPPSGRVGERRTLRFIKYLPNFGWKPIVLTGPAEEVEFNRNTGYVGAAPIAEYRASILGLLEIARAVKVFFKKGPASRKECHISSKARFQAQASNEGLSRKDTIKKWLAVPDEQCGWIPFAYAKGRQIVEREGIRVLYTNGPPHSCHVVGALLARRTGLPWVMDLRDPWSRRPWLADDERRTARHRLICALEAWCVQTAQTVVLNTERMRNEFRRFYTKEPPEKFVCIPNACDPITIPSDIPDDKIFTLVHTGALYKKRNPGGLLKAIALLRDRKKIDPSNFKLYLVGRCSTYLRVPDMVKDLLLDDLVHLVPPVKHIDSLRYLARSHVLLLIQPDTDLQVPAKIFEYMLFHKPILALTGEGALKDLIIKYHLGKVVDPQRPENIAVCIQEILLNFQSKGLLSCNHTEAINHFNPEKLTKKLGDIFHNLTFKDTK